jgi:hypothetical protein
MSTPEGRVKNRVKKMLKAHGAYYFMPVQTGYGSPGLDFHGCHRGKAFAVETKAPGKKPTPRQQLVITEMEESGMKVFVIGESLVSTFDVDVFAGYSGEAELEAWLLKLLS